MCEIVIKGRIPSGSASLILRLSSHAPPRRTPPRIAPPRIAPAPHRLASHRFVQVAVALRLLTAPPASVSPREMPITVAGRGASRMLLSMREVSKFDPADPADADPASSDGCVYV